MGRRKIEVEKPGRREPRRLAEKLNSTQESTRQITANFNAAMQTKAKSESNAYVTTHARRSES